MRISVGDRIGPYEIVDRLGEGGMGVVYRARDTRLGRDVALKVLPETSGADPSRRERFEREARALAALNHPHIAAIHDVIQAGDEHAIVMELVAGPTLADRIASGPLQWREVIGVGIDVSEALAAAHTSGIVHRDLKPANIAFTNDGGAKVLDFGIAKLAAADDGAFERPTTAVLTNDLAVIGTVGYMSPEQAQGQTVDARSDIFALGAVLYEALSGRRPFQGDTAAAVVAAVLRDDPPRLSTIVPSLPRAVERCVTRCLDKDPRRRYQNAADLKLALEDVLDDLAVPVNRDQPPQTPAAVGRRAWVRRLSFAAAALAIATGGFIVGGADTPAPFAPSYRPFITEVTAASHPAWSPDGRTLAYLDVVDGQSQLFVRGIDSVRSTLLTKERASGPPPFWAPDGSKIYFTRADGWLVSVSAGGGEPQVVFKDDAGGGNPFLIRACISPDGATIVSAQGQVGGVQLWAFDTRTGDARVVDFSGLPRPLVTVQALAFSPNGRMLAVLASNTAANISRGIWLVSWPDGATRHIAADIPYVFPSQSTISWMPDSRRIVVTGLAPAGGPWRLLMVDTGNGTANPLTTGRSGDDRSPTVAPDGSRIAFVARSSDSLDLIRFPIDGGPPEPLVATSVIEDYPDVSGSGLLAYISTADGRPAVRLRSPGDSWSRPLVSADGFRDAPAGEVRLSPDGQRAVVGTFATDHVLWVVPTAGGTPVRIDSESTDHHGPSWSPDGNWIAYRRLVSGAWSIVKKPLGGGAAVRLDEANPGGGATDWSPTGEWIAHARPDGMHLVSPEKGSIRVLTGLRAGSFRFSHDGARLFAIRRGEGRRWELTIWDVAAGRELRAVPLPVASGVELQQFALAPDDASVIASVGMNRSDIWLLEQFEPPRRSLSWIGR